MTTKLRDNLDFVTVIDGKVIITSTSKGCEIIDNYYKGTTK